MMPSSNHHSDLTSAATGDRVGSNDFYRDGCRNRRSADNTYGPGRPVASNLFIASKVLAGTSPAFMQRGEGAVMAQHTSLAQMSSSCGWVQELARVRLVHGNTPLTWLYSTGDECGGWVVRRLDAERGDRKTGVRVLRALITRAVKTLPVCRALVEVLGSAQDESQPRAEAGPGGETGRQEGQGSPEGSGGHDLQVDPGGDCMAH